MEITRSNEKGNLIINEEAISSIAINAAKDVDGVSSFSSKPMDVVGTIKKGSLKVMTPCVSLRTANDMDISIYINLFQTKKSRLCPKMYSVMYMRQSLI